MSYKVAVVYFLACICIVIAYETPADKTITFSFVNPMIYQTCISSHQTFHVNTNETLYVRVLGPYFHNATCLTNSRQILIYSNFVHRERDIATAEITSTSQLHNGRWDCVFTLRNLDREIRCNVLVNVTATDFISDQSNFGLYYIIGGVVAAVVIIIIIVQTVIIIHYKSKVLHRLDRQRPFRRVDESRYSETPGRKASRIKRESSCIYESLENISAVPKTNIKDRPPMPLPIQVESDEDSIYADGNTLTRMFSPPIPPIEAIPKRKKGNTPSKSAPKLAPKPAKPVVVNNMEEYEYADSDEMRPTNLPTKQPFPLLPKPDIPFKSQALHMKQRPTPPRTDRPSGPQVPIGHHAVPGLHGPPASYKPQESPRLQRSAVTHVPPRSYGPPRPQKSPERQGSPEAHGFQGAYRPPGTPNTTVITELDNILKKRRNAKDPESPIPFKGGSPMLSPTPQRFRDPGLQSPQGRETRSPPNTWQQPKSETKPINTWSLERSRAPKYPQNGEDSLENRRQPTLRGGVFDDNLQGMRSQEPWCREENIFPDRVQAIRSPHMNRRKPNDNRAPQAIAVQMQMMKSPPLPRKPYQGGNKPVPLPKMHIPSNTDTDSMYEPVAEAANDSEDEEWQIEELKPYNIYNI